MEAAAPAAAAVAAAAHAVESATLPDWSRLPEDLLIDVMASLEIADLVRCGAVCSSWYSCSTFRRLRLPQGPCLLYSCEEDGPDTATLHSLSGHESLRVRLPDPPLRSRSLIGSAYGWLITADEYSNLHLLNPLTGSQIALPPVWELHQVEKSTDEHGNIVAYIFHAFEDTSLSPVELSFEETRESMNYRVVLSCSPSAGSACIVLLMHYNGMISFARSGDDRWTWASRPEIFQQIVGYDNAVYNNDDGLFYVVDFVGVIYTLDLNGPSPVAKKILPEPTDPTDWIDFTKHIVLTPQGELLQVRKVLHFDESSPVTTQIPAVHGGHEVTYPYVVNTVDVIVRKVDIKQQKLVKTNLEEYVLFLGFNCPFLVSSKNFPMLKPNCAYLTDDCQMYIEECKHGVREISIWDFKSKTLQNLHDACPPRRPWLNCPAPIWVMPSLD